MQSLKALILSWVCLASQASNALTLNVLEWEGYISPYAEDFSRWAREEHNLDVELNILQPYITNPIQIFESLRAGAADVVTPTHNYYKMNQNQLIQVLMPIDTRRLSNYDDLLNSLQNLTFDTHEGQKYSVPLLGGSYALAYNADKVSPPESWEVLWDPANKGRFSLTDDQFEANIYLSMLMAGYSPADFYNIDAIEFDRAKVQRLLNELVANAHSFWGGMAQPEVMNQLTYTTTYWLGVAYANREQQNWKIALPQEGQTVWIDTMALARQLEREPEKLRAALLLLDFMISAPVQSRIHQDYGLMMVNAEVAESLSVKQGETKSVNNADFWREEWLWKPLSRRTRNTYKAMWLKAKAAHTHPENISSSRREN